MIGDEVRLGATIANLAAVDVSNSVDRCLTFVKPRRRTDGVRLPSLVGAAQYVNRGKPSSVSDR